MPYRDFRAVDKELLALLAALSEEVYARDAMAKLDELISG